MGSLSGYDRARIVAHYNWVNKATGDIDPKLFEGRTEAEIKYLRKTVGTTMSVSCGIEFSVEYKDVPRYEHFNFIIMAKHLFNKSGQLPFSGSLDNQPAQIMEILELLFELDSEREEQARQKQKREQSRNVSRR